MNECKMAKHAHKETQMWYVMQVRSGTEHKTLAKLISLANPQILEKGFVPLYEQKKRYQGQWHVEEKILFPGYVFLITDQIDNLVQELSRILGASNILKTGDEIVPLSEQEVDLMQRMGRKEQKIEMSIGIIENDKVQITSGPLVGMEGLIKKINRHKRIAWLSLEMFGGATDFQVGLEIIKKVEA
jgi:transcriptional antiterminator NusG